MAEIFLFDLDGTLTESGTGIVNSVAYALEHFKIPVSDEKKELYRFVGPSLKDAFSGYYGFDEKQTMEAIRVYREYYTRQGMFENRVYDGVEELLSSLKANGKRLMVATSKPEIYARQILDYFHLSSYFAFIGGSLMSETRTDKTEVIRYVFESTGITDVSRAVMVGDRSHDMIGAKNAGIKKVGVLYGYGTRAELEEAEADLLIETPMDLIRYADNL